MNLTCAIKEPVELANELIMMMRHDEVLVLGVLAEASRRASNPKAAQRWLHLAHRLNACSSDGELLARPQDVVWRQMQLIERCRHRANQSLLAAECFAEEPQRAALLEIAAQWRELAVLTELCVTNGAPAAPTS
jgi:hypothetical protein